MNPSASRRSRRAAVLAVAHALAGAGALAWWPASAQQGETPSTQARRAQQQQAGDGKAPRVKLSTTAGDIVIELYPDKAPRTVENFLQYVRDKHYDGTVFHRVINDFMIQGGGFDTRYVEKPTREPVPHEGQQALARGGPRNVPGTVAMARTSDPQSATAQFFINTRENPFLDPTVIPPGDPVPRFEYQGRVYQNVPRATLERSPQLYGYTVFGKVVEGMDVVRKIESARTGGAGPFPTDVPKKQVVIKSATILNP